MLDYTNICTNNILVNEQYGFRNNNPDLAVSVLFPSLAGRESLQIQRVTVSIMYTQPWTMDRGYPPACGD